MTLSSSLPTVYDLTPDYASNLAGSTDLFWPGDQGRWQAANLAALTPEQMTEVKGGMSILGGLAAAVLAYKHHGLWGALLGGFIGSAAPVPALAVAWYESNNGALFPSSGSGFSGYSPRRRRRRYGRR